MGMASRDDRGGSVWSAYRMINATKSRRERAILNQRMLPQMPKVRRRGRSCGKWRCHPSFGYLHGEARLGFTVTSLPLPFARYAMQISTLGDTFSRWRSQVGVRVGWASS
jgi:hypothetical protein